MIDFVRQRRRRRQHKTRELSPIERLIRERCSDASESERREIDAYRVRCGYAPFWSATPTASNKAR